MCFRSLGGKVPGPGGVTPGCGILARWDWRWDLLKLRCWLLWMNAEWEGVAVLIGWSGSSVLFESSLP